MTESPITVAMTNSERTEVQALFEETIGDIDPAAVPKVENDRMFDPIVAQIRDEDGTLLAAALTCRGQRAAAAARMAKMLRAGTMDPTGVVDAVDLHSELDLMAVRASHQGQGFGSRLVEYLEERLVEKGVQAWSGNVVDRATAPRLRSFYERLGFTVLPDGAPMPKLLGRDWSPLQATLPPVFSFYKLLGGAQQPQIAQAPRRTVRPPDPAKARRSGSRKVKRKRR